MEEATKGFLDGVGFGFFQHAALITKTGADYIEVLHARGRRDGVGIDRFYLQDILTKNIKRLLLLNVQAFPTQKPNLS